MNPKGGMPEVVRRASFYLHMCAVGAICVCLFKPNTDATLLIATTTTTLVWDGACVSTSPSLSPKPLFDWLTFLLCSACWRHLPVLTYSPGTGTTMWCMRCCAVAAFHLCKFKIILILALLTYSVMPAPSSHGEEFSADKYSVWYYDCSDLTEWKVLPP